MIYCKKKPVCSPGLTNKSPHEDKHIYDIPKDIGVVYINPAHGLREVTSFDNQEHQVLHSSNYNRPTIDQNIPNSAYPQTNTIIANADNVKEDNTQLVIYNIISTISNVDYKAEATSAPHGALNPDKNGETVQYAPITLPPSDEPISTVEHSTTKVSWSSQIASSAKTTEEGQYGPIIQLPSDQFPIANECLTTKVSSSSQGVDTEHS